jgi:nonribosomal peptide synthetase DhbF
VPVAGRTDAGLEDLAGFFVNTLVLCISLAGDPSFADLLGRVRECWLGALDHQDVPFEHLVEALALERSMSRHPLFQVALAVQNNAAAVLELPGLRAEPVAPGGPGAKFDLEVSLGETFGSDGRPAGIAGQLIAATDLFEAGTAQAIAARLVRVLAEVAAQPRLRVHRVEVLGVVEREQMAGRSDPAAAVLVAALLAVWQAGAAYLPVDPAYPAERIAFMLADARPAVLVTSQDVQRQLPPGDATPLVVLEELDGGPDGEASGVPDPRHPAYVIYTSGSTGRPKGVVISHANVARLFGAVRDRFGFGAEDVWAFCHSFAFDFSVWEMWGALVHGGRMVVVPSAVTRSPAELLGLLARERVSVLSQTSSAFYQLAAAVGAVGAVGGRGGRGGRGDRPGPGGAAGGLRRRGAGYRPAAGLAGPAWCGRAGAGQHVRHHRDHGARHLEGARCRGAGRQSGRTGHSGVADLCAGPVAGPGPGWGDR